MRKKEKDIQTKNNYQEKRGKELSERGKGKRVQEQERVK